MNKNIIYFIGSIILIYLIAICIKKLIRINEKFEETSKKNTLVLYTFHKYDKNVQFFIDNGVFKDDNIDFIFIINDPILKVNCPDYVKVINRENKGYDFGAWSEGLLTNNLYKNYNTFIFINSSVIGPIMPPYYKGKWTNIFLNGLSGNIKLYGSLINPYGWTSIHEPHVQSYAFCTDKEALQVLINNKIFSMTNQINDWKEVIAEKEIKMSTVILDNGWNIGCIFIHYKNIDFRKVNKDKAYYTPLLLGNLTTNKYYNEYIHPYEILFIKEKYVTNKDWINHYIDNYQENFESIIKLDIDISSIYNEEDITQYNNIGKFDNSVNKKHYLSILTTFKNETMILDTWIKHYLWQGVEHFYLIDNDSNDEPLNILQPYIDQGIVTLYVLPVKHKQIEHLRYVYEQENLKENTTWLINADMDEFFYCKDKNIKEQLNNYMDYNVIYSNWRMFGSDGLKIQPKDIRVSIIYREPEYNSHTKYIIQTKNINSYQLNLHEVSNNSNNINLSDIFRLNHYPIQSEEYFRKVKMTRGAADSVNYDNFRDMNYFNRYDQNKTFEDNDLKNLINNYS